MQQDYPCRSRTQGHALLCRGGYTCTDRRVETQVREPAPGAEPSIPPGGALRGSEGVLEASVLRVWESSLHLSELFGRGSLLGGGVLGEPPAGGPRSPPRRALPGGLSTPLGRGAGRWRTSTREGLSKPPCELVGPAGLKRALHTKRLQRPAGSRNAFFRL